MDIQMMRDLVEEYDAEPSTNSWEKRARDVIDLFTNTDPLTLDAAVKVMGREHRESCSTLFVWDEESIFVTKNAHEDRVSIVRMWGKDFYLPTIGLFACLVAAARMGEKA